MDGRAHLVRWYIRPARIADNFRVRTITPSYAFEISPSQIDQGYGHPDDLDRQMTSPGELGISIHLAYMQDSGTIPSLRAASELFIDWFPQQYIFNITSTTIVIIKQNKPEKKPSLHSESSTSL
ncbi:hypothetical protein CERZMDRAFT_91690 [Cercospora zeae-maydis SCOH1-5]|uniref:Uncharacterized protein n=1 Tax=Cercospora zeae-maydis SCOH1-5 TaxID=717836 RepID=A0A6A6F5U9_9PEZI|nr:hypothetical protein CERZMDRAFT_91690 [Cercospora zeae-maydis SCOH1-5]